MIDEIPAGYVWIAETATTPATFCCTAAIPYVDYGPTFVDRSKSVKALGTRLEQILRTLDETAFPKNSLGLRLDATGKWSCYLRVPGGVGESRIDSAVRCYLSQVMADGYGPTISGEELALLPQRTFDQIRTSALDFLRKPPVSKALRGASRILDCSFRYAGRDLLVVHGPLRAQPDEGDLKPRTGFVIGTIDGERLSERALWVYDPKSRAYTQLRFEHDEQLQEAKALAALGPVRFFYSRTWPNGKELLSLSLSERA